MFRPRVGERLNISGYFCDKLAITSRDASEYTDNDSKTGCINFLKTSSK